MKRHFHIRALLAALLALTVAPAWAAPVKVAVVKTASGWQLERDGKPFFVKGAGGTKQLDLLASSGANSVRTWGADNLEPLLDEAQKLGLTVTVGIWLHHENDTEKFSYDNAEMLKGQLEAVRQSILKYKDHPAVLMWGIGNEMEGYADGGNPKIWKHVNDAAKLAKELDPNHPVMTVIAEIGSQRIPSINQYCPDVDIVGINSYAGAASLASRYSDLKPVKPFVVTEFGPPGHWECGKTSWDAPLEPSSAEKAAQYRRSYEGSIAKQPWCLGSYAFLWGNKQEATATWYGMLLPDGSKVNAVDTMTELWSGKPAKNPCPSVDELKLAGADQVKPGQTIKVNLKTSNAGSQPVKVRWVVQPEQTVNHIGGKEEPKLAELASAIVSSDEKQCELQAPKEVGGYRVFAYVSNGAGSSVANVPFRVQTQTKPIASGKSATLPFCVYQDMPCATNHYAPTGWMGKADAIKLDPASRQNPFSAPTCIQVQFNSASEWGGIAWQDPINDWGDRDGGFNLTGAKRLVFHARGEQGGEVVSFKFGILGSDKKYSDSASGAVENVKLTSGWKEYSIDLAGKELAHIKTGFVWSLAGQGRPVTFYLDDIRYE